LLAATVTHNVVISYQAPSGVVTASVQVTNDTELNQSFPLLSTDTNKTVVISITQSNLQSLCLYSPQTLSITPSNGIAPGTGLLATINLSGGVPLIWYRASGATCPLATNVTSMILSNSSGFNSQFQMFSVLHQESP
jgi:hypothetical protein